MEDCTLCVVCWIVTEGIGLSSLKSPDIVIYLVRVVA